jgi:site-specific recombinase XerD
LDKFCEEYNIPKDRNISLHSLKKAGTDFVYNHTGGDIVRTAKAAHHSSIDVTYKRYLLKNEKVSDQPTYALHQDKPDFNKLKGLNKKQLLKLIEQCDSHIIRQLIGIKERLFGEIGE